MRLTRREAIGGGAATLAAPRLARAAPSARHDVAVVGAGVFGAWTAEHLRRAGRRVVLIDAWGPAHARASSGGESRMTRAAYGPDAIYAAMARDALPEWRALSARAGLPIFTPTGVLFFFPSDDPYARATIEVHRRLGLPTQVLGRAEMVRRFPAIDFTGVEVGLYEPQFGALMARRAVQTLVMRFVQQGGAYLAARVLPPAPGPALDALRTATGETIAADRFVFATGPWLPKLFPAELAGRIFPTRQEVFFFAPPAGDPRFQPGRLPGWADFNGGDLYYGFPDLEARGVKFARDTHGPPLDPDGGDRVHTPADLARIRTFIARRFPLLRDAPLVESRVCQYENSANGDFLIDRHPVWDNVTLVGAGSGHGFKHGPEVGRLAAALALGQLARPEPRFSLASKRERQDRAVH